MGNQYNIVKLNKIKLKKKKELKKKSSRICKSPFGLTGKDLSPLTLHPEHWPMILRQSSEREPKGLGINLQLSDKAGTKNL